jgi:hypothetical protein
MLENLQFAMHRIDSGGLLGWSSQDGVITSTWYAVIMIRTQISLSEREYRAAKREAARLGISLAALLRRSLRTILPADDAKPWMRYAGLVETGDPNASQTIDDVVYGQKD